MRCSIVLLVLVSAALAFEDIQQEWEAYKAKHNKQYSGKEDLYRRELFANTKRTVEEHNRRYMAGQFSYTRALNQFADLTADEARLHLSCISGVGTRNISMSDHVMLPGEVPAEVDWRRKGAVTRVKNQGLCGSCWAFSTTGALEGLNFLKNGNLVELSEQNLVDCDKRNMGCQGGIPSTAYQYIKEYGIDTEASYPYTSAGGQVFQCRYKPEAVGARVSGVVGIKSRDEEALKHAVATIGPISVAIKGDLASFQQYGGGVYYDANCSEDVNHAVTLVGYGTLNGQDYWLVKNSWDTRWGEQGYGKMARNRNNHCGIASDAVYPVVV